MHRKGARTHRAQLPGKPSDSQGRQHNIRQLHGREKVLAWRAFPDFGGVFGGEKCDV